jgi:asparagine N-glycosylation enzyme membrane subunit Stt3
MLTAADTEAMMLTIPFVVYGFLRPLAVHRREREEQRERVLVTDPWILATVASWTITAALVLGVD